MIDIVDQLAREWDGCEYETPGEAIDIGDAIRTAGFRRVHALFDGPGSSPPARERAKVVRPKFAVRCERGCATAADCDESCRGAGLKDTSESPRSA